VPFFGEDEYRRNEAECWLSILDIYVEPRDLAEVERAALARFGRCNARTALAWLRHNATTPAYDALCSEAPSPVAISLLHTRVNEAIRDAYPELHEVRGSFERLVS
jgi:hypothetical protein